MGWSGTVEMPALRVRRNGVSEHRMAVSYLSYPHSSRLQDLITLSCVRTTTLLQTEILRCLESHCDNCGRCCTETAPEVATRELRRIFKHLQLSSFKVFLAENVTFREEKMVLKTPCPFHRGDRCEIYPVRPSVCFLYPFKPGVPVLSGIGRCALADRIGDELVKAGFKDAGLRSELAAGESWLYETNMETLQATVRNIQSSSKPSFVQNPKKHGDSDGSGGIESEH